MVMDNGRDVKAHFSQKRGQGGREEGCIPRQRLDRLTTEPQLSPSNSSARLGHDKAREMCQLFIAAKDGSPGTGPSKNGLDSIQAQYQIM